MEVPGHFVAASANRRPQRHLEFGHVVAYGDHVLDERLGYPFDDALPAGMRDADSGWARGHNRHTISNGDHQRTIQQCRNRSVDITQEAAWGYRFVDDGHTSTVYLPHQMPSLDRLTDDLSDVLAVPSEIRRPVWPIMGKVSGRRQPFGDGLL